MQRTDLASGPVIEVSGVTKSFTVRRGRWRSARQVVTAVSDLDLSIAPGEVVGYIGPNGAGKSTTIKMLTGILVPTTGSIRVGGVDPQRHRVTMARQVGVVFGQRTQLWWDLPLGDSFDLLRHIYRVPAARHAENLASFIELLDLGPLLAVPVRQLSLGQRVRGEITAALLHDPSVVYLDEPTIGLDVISKSKVREFLTRINAERQVTIMLTTHDLDDVESLCSRLVVIDHGQIVYDGTIEDLKARYAPYRTVVADLAEPGPALQVPFAEVIQIQGPRQWVRFRQDQATAAEVVSSIVTQAALRDLTVEEASIEDVIRHIYDPTGATSAHGLEL
jgi:ABC-2 type transport system ATP-binding protein